MTVSGESPYSDVRWHEYEDGLGTEWINALCLPLLPFLGGVASTFVCMIVAGVMAEQNIFTRVSERWLAHDQAFDVNQHIDLALRMTLIPMAAYGYLAIAALVLASTVVTIRTSRRMAAAAETADPGLVPPPGQIGDPDDEPLSAMRLFAKVNLFVGGCAALMLGSFAAIEGSKAGWTLTALTTAYAGGLWFGVKKAEPRYNRRHHQQWEIIDRHWTTENRDAARARASVPPESADAQTLAIPGQRRQRIGKALVVIPLAMVFIGGLLMQIGLGSRHPGSSKYRLAEPREYGGTGETLITAIWWIVFIDVAIALLMIVVAAMLRQSGTLATETWLRTQAADPAAVQPPHVVVLDYTTGQSLPAIGGVGFISGMVCVFGTSVALLGSFDMGGLAEIYRGSDRIFADYVRPALGAVGGILLMNVALSGLQVWHSVRGRAFRNLLRERWPVRVRDRNANNSVDGVAASNPL